MRPVLRLLGTRYGISLVMAILVLAVVATFRGIAGSRHDAMSVPDTAPSPTAPASVEPNDGIALPSDLPSGPQLDTGAAKAATTAANEFAAAWLRHTGVTATEWHKGLRQYATQSLSTQLQGVDPATVPADQVAGETKLKIMGQGLVEVTIPMNSGTLGLRLTVVETRWRVDAVTWEPAR